jgi:urea carboxylase-associated protein 2
MSTTATTYGARDHARAQDGTVVEAMPVIPASGFTDPPPGVAAADLIWAETVAAGGYTHKVLARGSEIRLTDLHGDACAHLLLFNADAPWERLNIADTTKVQWNAYLGASTVLLSDQARVLATVLSDDSGHHDALCGTSTVDGNIAAYGDGSPHGPPPSGAALFTLAAAKHGLTPRDLPPSLSLFQRVQVEADGGLTFAGSAGPGTSVVLRAELPVIVLIANVAHPLDPRPDYTVSPLHVLAWRGSASTSDSPQWTATPEARRAFENTADYLTARGQA